MGLTTRHTTLLTTLLAACATAVEPEDLPSLPDPKPPVADDASLREPLVWDVPAPPTDAVRAAADVGVSRADVVTSIASDVPAVVGDAVDIAAPVDVARSNRRVLVVTLDDETQRACGPHGWTIVTWDPTGIELPPSDPGAPLRIEFPWSWRGMLGVGMRCESGHPVYYRDLSPHLDYFAARAGVRAITLDGRDITSRTRVCDPPWVRAARPDWPAAWRTVVLVPIEAALEGVCPR